MFTTALPGKHGRQASKPATAPIQNKQRRHIPRYPVPTAATCNVGHHSLHARWSLAYAKTGINTPRPLAYPVSIVQNQTPSAANFRHQKPPAHSTKRVQTPHHKPPGNSFSDRLVMDAF